jgi:hypothetical protein
MHTVVARVARVAVEFSVAHAHIGAHEAIAKLHAADTALEAVNVVEEAQALNDHRRSPTCNFFINLFLIKCTFSFIIIIFSQEMDRENHT